MKFSPFVSRSISRACAGAFVLGFSATLVGTPLRAWAESQTIYKETFQYCTASLGKPAADETGWLGLVTGLPKEKFSNLKVFSYGSRIVGGSINSSPWGKAEGYSFWFRPTYGLSFLTAEFPFDVGLISKYPATVEYEQRLSGIDAAGVMNQTQLIFLIDDNWYISGTATRQSNPNRWEPVRVDPSELLYGVVPYVTGLGAATPNGYATSLPTTGTVRAFGVFAAEVNGRVRIDNFTITTTGPIPAGMSTAVQPSSVASCPPTSPDVTGGPAPTPTPDPDDSDGGVDRGTPESPFGPGGSNPRAQNASFCSTSEQGSGLKVRVSRRSLKAFVTKGLAKGTIGLRDRALAYLYATRLMPVGALVNVRIGDYDPSARTLKVSLKKGAPTTSVKVSRQVQSSLKRYLSALGPQASATDPLFGAITTGSVNMKNAACTPELKRVIAQRAKAAKISTKRIYVR
ncbi:MAG: hypothetical protein RL518_2207 [Pseudomonadota bacterium]